MAEPFEALKQAPRDDGNSDGRQALLFEFLRDGRKDLPGRSRAGADIFGDSNQASLLETLKPLQQERSEAETKLSPEKKRELQAYREGASGAATAEEQESFRTKIDGLDPTLAAVNTRIRDAITSAWMDSAATTRHSGLDAMQIQRMSTIQCHRPLETARRSFEIEDPARKALDYARRDQNQFYAPYEDMLQQCPRRGVSLEFDRKDGKVNVRPFIHSEGEKAYLAIDNASPVGPQLDRMIEKKMTELERNYNVAFYRADQPVVKQTYNDGSGKWIQANVELTARQPSLHEMYGVAEALEISKCSLTGPKMKIAFLSEKTSGSYRPAGEHWSDLKGAPTVIMFGDRDLENKNRTADDDRWYQSTIKEVMIHEVAHHNQYRSDFWENKDLINALGWQQSTNASKEWMLRGKNGEFYKVDSGETGTSRMWCQVNANGEAIDDSGKRVEAGKEINLSSWTVRDKLQVKPISGYFDNACEMHAETLTNFRAGGQRRADMIKVPELYEPIKRYDQAEIDQYYAKAFPGRHGIRLPNGQIADRTSETEKRVSDFEKLMMVKNPERETISRLYDVINLNDSVRRDGRYSNPETAATVAAVEEKTQKAIKQLDELAPDMKILDDQNRVLKEGTGKACLIPKQNDSERYKSTRSETYANYAVFLLAHGKPEQAKEYLKEAAQIGKAKELEFSYPGMRAEDIVATSQLSSSVDFISITNVPITKEVGEAVARFSKVSTLEVEGTRLDEAAFGKLCALPKLKELTLNSVTGLTDAHFQQMPEMTELRSLQLSGTSSSALSGDILKNVKHLPALESLALGRIAKPDAALAHLKNHQSLERLRLDLSSDSVKESSLAPLATLPNLKYLYLHGPITGAALKQLQAKSLLSLSISGSANDIGEGLSVVKAMPNLDSLRIYAPISDEQLSQLEGAKSLRQVTLSGENINGEGLKVFKTIPNLYSLSLEHTQISGDTIAVLQNCQKLQFLNISTSGTIPPETIAELKKKLPKCYINIKDKETQKAKEAA